MDSTNNRTSLLAFPGELWSSITPYLVAADIVVLILVGNRVLSTKLRSGVRTFNPRNLDGFLDCDTLFRMASSFPQINSLSITGITSSQLALWPIKLDLIPRTLTSLLLSFSASIAVFFDITSNPSALVPNLTRLDLTDHTEKVHISLKNLPPRLERLYLKGKSSWDLSDLEHLPNTIQELDVYLRSTGEPPERPLVLPNLTSLAIQSVHFDQSQRVVDVRTFPSSLTRLHLFPDPVPIALEEWRTLFPVLRKLTLYGSTFVNMCQMDMLPLTLEELELSQSFIWGGADDNILDDIAARRGAMLSSMSPIKIPERFWKYFTKLKDLSGQPTHSTLPSNLEGLTMPTARPSQLPAKLQTLSSSHILYESSETGEVIPLADLAVNEIQRLVIPLPPSITALLIGAFKISAQHVMTFPLGLEKLSAHIHDGEAGVALQRLPKLVQLISHNGQTSIVEHLPITLTHLVLIWYKGHGGDMQGHLQKFKNLTFLGLQSSNIDSDVLTGLPPNLRYIYTGQATRPLTREDLRSLPRSLYHFDVVHTFSWRNFTENLRLSSSQVEEGPDSGHFDPKLTASRELPYPARLNYLVVPSLPIPDEEVVKYLPQRISSLIKASEALRACYYATRPMLASLVSPAFASRERSECPIF